jgi:hypothetical protein
MSDTNIVQAIPTPAPTAASASRRFRLRETLGVLPQALVLGLLPLGFPTPRLARPLERLEVLLLELDIGAGDSVALHNGGCVFVPFGTENVETDNVEVELVAEALDGEPLAAGTVVRLLELGNVEFLIRVVLEDKDGETVIG